MLPTFLISESSDPDIGDGDGRVIFEDPLASPGDDKVGTYLEILGLDNGVIRLIGRYLKDDPTQEYKVMLHAVLTQEGRDAWITITIKKPVRLFDPKAQDAQVGTHTYDATIGIRGNSINIDSLCIVRWENRNLAPSNKSPNVSRVG